MSAPRLDRDEISRRLETLDHEPFREELAKLLESAPDEESILEFASKHPDKWTKAIQVMAGLCGYQIGKETTQHTNIYTQINVLSDSELDSELKTTLEKLKSGELIEHDGSKKAPA